MHVARPLLRTFPGLSAVQRGPKGGPFLTDSGTLVFRVFTSVADLPVEGAAVLVRLQDSGALLGVRVTNSSGETDPTVIETPSDALSQAPENTIQPWTGLQVMIEHPEYERVLLTGLQVFPGIETVQTVRLIPLKQFDPESSGQQEYSFTPQPVWEGAAP